jgi:cytochrome c5
VRSRPEPARARRLLVVSAVAVVFSKLSTVVLSLSAGFDDHRTGGQVYVIYCSFCHDDGEDGAPVVHVDSQWQARKDNGFYSMLEAVKNGTQGMPAMGQCGDCSDHELRMAIDYMSNPEPPW